jgi:hypothetical protein
VRKSLVLAGQADECEDFGHGLLDESARGSDDLESERDILEDGLVRQEAEVLEHRADVPAEIRHLAVGQRAQVATEHDDTAVARRLLAQDESQARGLARPEAPTRNTNSPRSTSKSTLLRAGLAVPRKRFVTFSNRIMAIRA